MLLKEHALRTQVPSKSQDSLKLKTATTLVLLLLDGLFLLPSMLLIGLDIVVEFSTIVQLV